MTSYNKFAFTSYETFLLSQYHIPTNGLYYTNGKYLIYCPTITEDTKSLDGKNIHRWLNDCKIIGTDISLANSLPEHAVKIDNHVNDAKSPGTGYLITNHDLKYEINLLIPGIFPDYEVRIANPVMIAFSEEVTPEGVAELKDIFKKNQFPFSYEFIYDPNAKNNIDVQKGQFASYIIPARQAKKQMGKLLAEMCEEDEDNWMNDRAKILADVSSANSRDKYFDKKKFRCIVDCNIGVPSNIRNYLSLYDEICIVPPAKNVDRALQGLAITKEELIRLAEMKKIHILAPSSPEIYDQSLMEGFAEANRSNVHLARRLSSLILRENGARNPLFLPSISLEERKILLQSCDEAAQALDPTSRQKLQKMLSEMGSWWVRMPNAVNQLSSGLLSGFGIPHMLNILFSDEENRGSVASLVAQLATPSIELTAAVGATFIPTDEYLTPMYRALADLYSGVPGENWMMTNPQYANLVVDELLVVGDKVPVLEFAQTFTGPEIKRFREIVLGISQRVNDLGELEENVTAFNHFVKRYEKDRKKLNIMNLSGFVLGQAAKSHGIPFASWLIKILQKNVVTQAKKNNPIASIVDQMEARAVNNFPDAVLVSSLKTKLKDKI